MSDDLDLSKTWVPGDSGEETESETRATVPRMSGGDEEPPPERIGRYAIEGVLGTGGYGRVYLAKDTELRRRVALKVPHLFAMEGEEAVERFLAEAQTVASLDHPGVVPIYDFGRWENRCYVVSKFIDGETLHQRRHRSPLTVSEAAKLIRSIAETLGFIHSNGVVHRDIKPSNLLLDDSGSCFITDFGLALRDFEAGLEPGQMGTISFMSPEQARGESHLVDGRSDLFSLGIVLYELLTGERPFTGRNWQAVIVMICYHEPKPPRQRVPAIPRELERICLKLLAKKPNDRYDNAADLIDDLNHFLETSTQRAAAVALPQRPVSTDPSCSTQDLVGIIPRGLRSFSREDAMFFRQLLPGPRDRDGIPDSLRFWQQRIQSNDPDESFRLGVIYGPSGSGKSSFVKAGLVPTLPGQMQVVFVEAAVGKTEDRLRNRIHGQCPETAGLGLKESLAQIRNSNRAAANSVLIVIDQFEQWLHGWDESPDAELAVALRQCDGDHVRAILLVRDDFWLALSRFADIVDFELVPARNLGMVDLFDKRHARRVLAEYGRGYARLPESLGELTKSQNAFLDEAIDGLATGDKIVPIQLAAFSEIMKGRDWDTKSLHEIGGVKGVGVRFLDESFSAVGAPANQRSHEAAVQSVLKSLLPGADTNIKGAMRSAADLRKAAGYEDQPKRFEQLIQILDTDLRLITPADASQDGTTEGTENEAEQRFYQLTHDFLVPAVRTWLERRQSLTISGRAALRLADRAEVWTARPDNRHLPSWFEWVSLLLFTRRSQRDVNQQKMMSAANRKHLLNTVTAAVLIAISGLGVRNLLVEKEVKANVRQLLTAEAGDVPAIIDDIARESSRAIPRLQNLLTKSDLEVDTRVKLLLALYRSTGHGKVLRELLSSVSIDSPELLLIARREVDLEGAVSSLVNDLWERVESKAAASPEKTKSLFLLAGLDPPVKDGEHKRWNENSDLACTNLIRTVKNQPSRMRVILEAFYPAKSSILESLKRVFTDATRDPVDRQWASSILRELWKDDAVKLTSVFLEAKGEQLSDFLPVLENAKEAVLQECRLVLDSQAATAEEKAHAAAFLFRNGFPDWTFRMLRLNGSVRASLIRSLRMLSAPSDLLELQLSRETDANVLSAIYLTLGSQPNASNVFSSPHAVVETAKETYLKHPSPLLHSSARWFLSTVGETDWLSRQTELLSSSLPSNAKWSIDGFGQEFVTLTVDDHDFEIAATEVTRQQFELFAPDHHTNPQFNPTVDCPVSRVSWLMAARYCRWLTTEAGLSEDQQCFIVGESADDLQVSPDFKNRLGYRLPSVAEWELAAESHHRRVTEMNPELWTDYAWLVNNSNDRTHPIATRMPGPNGLFDMVGNVTEWCQSRGGFGNGGSMRPIRGARYNNRIDLVLRYSTNGRLEIGTRYDNLGFRLARSSLANR